MGVEEIDCALHDGRPGVNKFMGFVGVDVEGDIFLGGLELLGGML